MDLRPVRRRIVAIVAAYAVALQALLAAFVPAGPAALAGRFAVLCSHDAAADGTGPPSQHDLPCAAACAAMGHGVSGPAPPGVVVALVEPNTVPVAVPAADWVSPRSATTHTHAPRGPPLA